MRSCASARGHLALVRMLVAVRHDLVAAGCELVPQAEVAHRPAMVFVRQHEIRQVRSGNHIDAGRQLVLLVDLRRFEARLLEAVVEAERHEMGFPRCARLFL